MIKSPYSPIFYLLKGDWGVGFGILGVAFGAKLQKIKELLRSQSMQNLPTGLPEFFEQNPETSRISISMFRDCFLVDNGQAAAFEAVCSKVGIDASALKFLKVHPAEKG